MSLLREKDTISAWRARPRGAQSAGGAACPCLCFNSKYLNGFGALSTVVAHWKPAGPIIQARGPLAVPEGQGWGYRAASSGGMASATRRDSASSLPAKPWVAPGIAMTLPPPGVEAARAMTRGSGPN